MYVATRGLYRMKPPTIVVPMAIKEDVENLFEVHRKMDGSELKHILIGLSVGNCRFVLLVCSLPLVCSLSLLNNMEICRRRVAD